jgi:hypothetical protein
MYNILMDSKTSLLSVALASTLFTSAISAAEPRPFVFATNGLAKAAVVVAPDAPEAVRYAADELADYLNRMTGAHFPVAEAPVAGWNTIRVGLAPDGGRFEEITIRASGDGQRLDILGERPRAVIYAAYDLLETLGCGFWTPNSETVPRKPYLALPAGYAKNEAPAMRIREVCHYTSGQRFRLKLRDNGARSVASGGVDVAPGEHEDIMHSLTLRWIPRNKFFASHPDWFALTVRKDPETGTNIAKRVQGALCATNPEMREELLKEVAAFLEKNYPRERSISLSPSDMGDWCHCPRCTALVQSDAKHVATVLYLDLVRFVADHFRDKYPEATFNLLSYWTASEPPADTAKWRLPSNCGVGFAALWRNHGFPIDCNERFAPRVKAWQEMADRFVFWDYYANFSAYLNPFPNLEIIAPALRFYRDHKFVGGFAQMPHSRMAPLADLNWYLMGKLMWNPDADTEALTDAFVKGVYGKAAPSVKRYMEIIRHGKLRDRGIWVGCYVADTSNFLAPEDVIAILRALDEANRAVGNEPESVREAVWRLNFTGIHTAAMRYPDLIEPAKKLKYKLAPWGSYTNRWHAYVSDYRSRRAVIGYPQQSREGVPWEKWGLEYFPKIMANGPVPTTWPPRPAPSVVVSGAELTGGSAMSVTNDVSEGDYAKLTFGFGGGERLFMNPSYAEVGHTVSNDLQGVWMVLAKMRIGATVTNNPAAAYMGVYTPWIVNGARIGRKISEIAELMIPSSPGEDGWRWVALGVKKLYDGARVWVMPCADSPSRFLDVRSIAFVDPAAFGKLTVPASRGGEGRRDPFDNYAYRELDCRAVTNGALSAVVGSAAAGDREVFARVRIVNGAVLDAAAGRLELWRKGAKPELLGSAKVFGSRGEEVWETVWLGHFDLKSGDEVRFVSGDSGNALKLSLRDLVLVDPKLLGEGN